MGAVNTPARSIPPSAFRMVLRMDSSSELSVLHDPQQILASSYRTRFGGKGSGVFSRICSSVQVLCRAKGKALVRCACHAPQMAAPIRRSRLDACLRNPPPRELEPKWLEHCKTELSERASGRSRSKRKAGEVPAGSQAVSFATADA